MRRETVEVMVGDRTVRIVRSTQRRRSMEAVYRGETVEVRVPVGLDPREEYDAVAKLVAKLERKVRSEHVDLAARARSLARRYDLPVPKDIRWVSNQNRRFGSCTPATGEIRISDRLASWPPWVLDYVVVHELAHLVHLHHNAAFNSLVDRYPLAERARGFLIAMGYDDEGGRSADPPTPPGELPFPELGGW